MHEDASSPTAACAECLYKNAQKLCMAPGGKHPETCPTLNQEAVLAAAMAEYAKPEIAAFARNASMVFKYSEAPCTVLAAKDRLFGHNPLAAVYTLDSYYRCLKQPLE